MKKTIALLLTLTTLQVSAATWDNQITVCKNQGLELTLKGKNGFFDSRTLTLKKNGNVILEEEYDVEEYTYNEHSAQYSLQLPPKFNHITGVAAKLKPKSVHFDSDFTFRVSDSAIVYHTYSALQPAFGGDTSAIIFELIETKQNIIFEEDTQCISKALK